MKNVLTKEALSTFVSFIKTEKDIKGKFIVTFKNIDKNYTYEVVCKNYKGNYFINIFFESSNQEFVKCAYAIDGRVSKLGKFRYSESKNVLGAAWFLSTLIKFLDSSIDFLLDNTIIQHTGTCIKCGRELTDAESVEYGMGKTCKLK